MNPAISAASSEVSDLSLSQEMSSDELTIFGVTVGTSTAILAWQGVQLFGIASTGTAIGGIYGAAATNAGWAAFGGGSLATGGGGMALGHLVLPGVGTLVAIGVGSVITHKRANGTNKLCDELESADRSNQTTLSQVSRDLQQLQHAEQIFDAANFELKQAIKDARRKLRRFGLVSVLYRYIRFRVTGIYYSAAEQARLHTLQCAVEKFMFTFGAK